MLGLPQRKPRERKRVLRGARRKGGIEFATKSELQIFISRTTKARFKGGAREDVRKKLPVNLVGKRSQTANHEGKDLTRRSLFMKALDMIIVIRQGFIDRDVIGTGLTMTSLGIVGKRRK